ncbi:MAG: hypothetical protein V4696_09145 [Pseudomonadota bacterium]
MAQNLATLNASLAIVDEQGRPQLWFQKQYQTVIQELRDQIAALSVTVDQIAEIVGLTEDLETAVIAVEAAVVVAQGAAEDAAASAGGANSVASLTNSGVTPNPLSATDAGANATINVAAHTRVYGDGTTLAIAGPTTLTGLAYSTLFYVYYDDATRADTTPTFLTTTSPATAAQSGDRHLVGSVTTPAAAAPPTTGDEVQLPGLSSI